MQLPSPEWLSRQQIQQQRQQSLNIMEQGDLRKRTAGGGNQEHSHGTSELGDRPRSIVPHQDFAQRRETPIQKRSFIFAWRHIVITTLLLLVLLAAVMIPTSKLQFLRYITMIPTLLSAYTGYQAYTRVDVNLAQWIIPLTMVVTVFCAQLPSSLATALAMAAVVVFSWSTTPDSRTHGITTNGTGATTTSAPGRGSSSSLLNGFVTTFVAVVAMIAVLLVENFLIWVVSATFIAGQNTATEPPPLQDNGQIVMKAFVFTGLSKAEVVGLRRLWNTQWVLVACMAAGLFCVQVQHQRASRGRPSNDNTNSRRTLFGVATRAVTTIAIARTVRTVSFVLTVLPSQVKNCYAQRFPPVAPLQNNTVAWILVGLQPRSHGGCNDLIISGHAVITSTLACVATSVADNTLFSVALWTMVAMDYAVEIYEGFHYSVDMWLGLLLVVLLWRVLQPLDGGYEIIDYGGSTIKLSSTSTTPSKPSDAFIYLPPALVTYIQLNFLSEATANFVIIGFVLAAVTVYVVFVVRGQRDEQQKQFLLHYIQHMGLCLLALALGVYL